MQWQRWTGISDDISCTALQTHSAAETHWSGCQRFKWIIWFITSWQDETHDVYTGLGRVVLTVLHAKSCEYSNILKQVFFFDSCPLIYKCVVVHSMYSILFNSISKKKIFYFELSVISYLDSVGAWGALFTIFIVRISPSMHQDSRCTGVSFYVCFCICIEVHCDPRGFHFLHRHVLSWWHSSVSPCHYSVWSLELKCFSSISFPGSHSLCVTTGVPQVRGHKAFACATWKLQREGPRHFLGWKWLFYRNHLLLHAQL